MSKTFLVAGHDGRKNIPAEQLATFAYCVQGEQFRFVVTRLGDLSLSVTHRQSGMRVCSIAHVSVVAALGDYELAGRSALRDLIARHGEARVRSVLSAATIDTPVNND